MILHSDDIAETIYDRLTRMGYAVSEDECQDIADVFFDLLLDMGIMQELDEIDEFDED